MNIEKKHCASFHLTIILLSFIFSLALTSCGANNNENFLNISWDSSPKDAVATITSVLERNDVKYVPPPSTDVKDIVILSEGDPFYDLNDTLLLIGISCENSKIKKIDLTYFNIIDSDYDHIVQKISKEFGEPNTNEKRAEIYGSLVAPIWTAIWTLEKTNIKVNRTSGSGSIEFTPKS